MEDSPSGLWRTLGKRVGVTASRVRISYPPLAGLSDDSESLFFMPENGSLSAIPTNLAHMPFCRVMPSNDVGNADIGDTHDGPNRCVTLTSKGTPACSLIPVRGHMHLTLPASAFSSVDVTLRVYTCLHWFTLFTGLDFSLLVQRLWMMWAHGFPGTMVFACDDRVSGGPMGRYARLALAEREEIVLLRHGGGSCGGMAGATGGDKATVSGEMAGNSFAVGSGRCHRASTAQRGCESRRVSCVRPGVLDGERGAGLVRRLVVREHWSPGRIAGGIAVEWPGLMVFASAIYRAINERRLDPPGLTRTRRGIRARLRHKGKRRHGRGGPEERRGKIPGARPIGQRPEIVGERSGLGDREGDTVVGKGAGACLVTLVDRRSGLLSGGRCAAHAVFRQINLRVVTS